MSAFEYRPLAGEDIISRQASTEFDSEPCTPVQVKSTPTADAFDWRTEHDDDKRFTSSHLQASSKRPSPVPPSDCVIEMQALRASFITRVNNAVDAHYGPVVGLDDFSRNLATRVERFVDGLETWLKTGKTQATKLDIWVIAGSAGSQADVLIDCAMAHLRNAIVTRGLDRELLGMALGRTGKTRALTCEETDALKADLEKAVRTQKILPDKIVALSQSVLGTMLMAVITHPFYPSSVATTDAAHEAFELSYTERVSSTLRHGPPFESLIFMLMLNMNSMRTAAEMIQQQMIQSPLDRLERIIREPGIQIHDARKDDAGSLVPSTEDPLDARSAAVHMRNPKEALSAVGVVLPKSMSADERAKVDTLSTSGKLSTPDGMKPHHPFLIRSVHVDAQGNAKLTPREAQSGRCQIHYLPIPTLDLQVENQRIRACNSINEQLRAHGSQSDLPHTLILAWFEKIRIDEHRYFIDTSTLRVLDDLEGQKTPEALDRIWNTHKIAIEISQFAALHAEESRTTHVQNKNIQTYDTTDFRSPLQNIPPGPYGTDQADNENDSDARDHKAKTELYKLFDRTHGLHILLEHPGRPNDTTLFDNLKSIVPDVKEIEKQSPYLHLLGRTDALHQLSTPIRLFTERFARYAKAIASGDLTYETPPSLFLCLEDDNLRSNPSNTTAPIATYGVGKSTVGTSIDRDIAQRLETLGVTCPGVYLWPTQTRSIRAEIRTTEPKTREGLKGLQDWVWQNPMSAVGMVATGITGTLAIGSTLSSIIGEITDYSTFNDHSLATRPPYWAEASVHEKQAYVAEGSVFTTSVAALAGAATWGYYRLKHQANLEIFNARPHRLKSPGPWVSATIDGGLMLADFYGVHKPNKAKPPQSQFTRNVSGISLAQDSNGGGVFFENFDEVSQEMQDDIAKTFQARAYRPARHHDIENPIPWCSVLIASTNDGSKVAPSIRDMRTFRGVALPTHLEYKHDNPQHIHTHIALLLAMVVINTPGPEMSFDNQAITSFVSKLCASHQFMITRQLLVDIPRAAMDLAMERGVLVVTKEIFNQAWCGYLSKPENENLWKMVEALHQDAIATPA